MNTDIKAVLQEFELKGRLERVIAFGSGHINDTFKVRTSECNYLLQRINRSIFSSPRHIMENMETVASHLLKEDYPQPILQAILTKNGRSLFFYKNNYWRLLPFFENTFSIDKVETVEQAYEGGRLYGQFLKYLEGIPTAKIKTIIPNFHNGTLRWRQFEEAIRNDKLGRAKENRALIKEMKAANTVFMEINKLMTAGRFPLRLTHNDTKINNILFDKTSKKAVAVVDWDTIMPNTILSDFGDMVRTFTNSAAEDEKEMSQIMMNMEMFEALSAGFLYSLKDTLQPIELRYLVEGAIWITYMQMLRFVTDYIDGNVYYKAAYETHNLVRARGQLILVQQMIARQAETKYFLE